MMMSEGIVYIVVCRIEPSVMQVVSPLRDSHPSDDLDSGSPGNGVETPEGVAHGVPCLLYTSDAADD